MRVLVTGASSNLGTFVLPALCEAGYDPVAVVHSGDVDDRYASIRCDLSRPLPESVTAQTWDGIVHLASSGAQTHQEILDIDITAMHQLLAQWTRGPFIYCSSQTVYGVPQGVLSEEHPLDPVTPYDWGKVANEFRLLQQAKETGRPANGLRIGLLCGPNQSDKTPQYLDMMTAALMEQRRFVFPSDKAMYLGGTSILGGQDAGRAFATALTLKQSAMWNVAGPYCCWRDILDGIAARLGLAVEMCVAGSDARHQEDFILPGSVSNVPATKFAAATEWSSQENLESILDTYVASLY